MFEVLVERLPAREDREPAAALFADVTADRLRMAIGRACRDAGVPHFGPHALRHRRISLLHFAGVSWADIGDRVGQRSKVVTADRYSHALVDYREIDVRRRSNVSGVLRWCVTRCVPRTEKPLRLQGCSRPVAPTELGSAQPRP